jgi:hypothetical protein
MLTISYTGWGLTSSLAGKRLPILPGGRFLFPGVLLWGQANALIPPATCVAPMLHRLFIVMPRRDVIEVLTKCRV